MVYHFGRFELDTKERIFRCEGQVISLTPKAFDTLVVLVENQGRLVDRETLLSRVWPDTFIEEATLAQNISTLRKAFGESEFIETVPKRGYRFVVVSPENPGRAGSAPRPRATAALAALVIVAAAAAFFAYTRQQTRSGSIAVLPFKSLNDDPSDAYLGLAMADALITRLGNIRGAVVRPTTSVRKYASRHDPLAAGRELGVDMVLDGNILHDGKRMRVSVQLLRVRGGTSVWSERFDVPSADIFTVQDRVSDTVAREMLRSLRIRGVGASLARHTNDPKAHEAYLKGRYFWNKRTEDGYIRAIEHFHEALRRDSNFARAWSGLADSYALLGSMANKVVSREEAMTRARDAAVRALALDDASAEAHTSYAWVKLHYEWDLETAGREFARALELDPGYATAHHWRSYYFLAQGKPQEAVASARRAHELDPLSMIISTDLAEMLYYARRYDESIQQLRKTLGMDPHFGLAHRLIAYNLLRKGDYEGAAAAARRSVQSERDEAVALLAVIDAHRGEVAKARRDLAEFESKYPTHSSSALAAASFHADAGNTERALLFLEEAARQRDGGLMLLSVEQAFDSLRSDARFQAISRQITAKTKR